MALIRMEAVSKDYIMGDTRVAALRGIDLTLDSGEFVAIWGPSGSGKSTLCNLMGLLDYPTRGVVMFKGQDVSRMTDDERSQLRNDSIGFVFQGFNLLPVLSALENVMFPLEVKGEKSKQARTKAGELLEQMGVGEFMSHRPQKLSGGQQQRVAIARALITEPRLVIADEPTANLDSTTAKSIIDLMRSINQKTGTTFIFSTHDQRLLNRVNRKVLLQDGTLAADDSADSADVSAFMPRGHAS
jgi:putative ABC transport system ATP-binding protein